jgi:hypothetical protein
MALCRNTLDLKASPLTDWFLRYPGYDPRYDIAWKQNRIEWGFSSLSPAGGIGPAQNMSSADMACRFAPVKPPALMAVARAGSEVTYNWGAYYIGHKVSYLMYSVTCYG